jgi:hypothetical protein
MALAVIRTDLAAGLGGNTYKMGAIAELVGTDSQVRQGTKNLVWRVI